MIRVAVVGVGAMGRNHVRVYGELPDVELVAVADANQELAVSIGGRTGARAYTDFKSLLERERPDAISVTVPTSAHYQVASAALEAACHVLVEKPITATVEQARALIESARRSGRVLAVGHVERFNPAILELKQRLDAGECGRVYQLHSRRLGPFPSRVRDVGVVVDLATHDLDIMRFLTGCRHVRLYAETKREIHTSAEDLLCGMLRFTDGSLGIVQVNWLTPTKIRELYVTGERGMFVVNYLTQDLYFYENAEASPFQWEPLKVLRGVSEGSMHRFPIHRREPLHVELETFIQAVKGKPAAYVSGQDALIALEMALELNRSACEQQVVQ